MIPYYVVKKVNIIIEAESGDTVVHFSAREAKHLEAIFLYYMEQMDDSACAELQKVLDFISITPDGPTH